MKCILLVAGYATRLYPLTKDKPKSLLDVAGKTILEHILDKIARISIVDEVILVSNDRFANQFTEWVNGYSSNIPISVLNDGTTSNETRLGAIADLQLAIENCSINDDILVMAGDNLFDFELTDFIDFFLSINADCITVNKLDDIEALRRTGVVVLVQNRKVMSFDEKPEEPKSNLSVPPFYIYRAETLPLIKQYLEEGNNPDAPGNLIPWLINYRDIYAYEFQGKRYDVGTIESYEEIKKLFRC